MSTEIASFEQLALSAPILQVLQEIGYESPSPIQAATIPPLLEGNDLLGQAQTGTGKTAAFALPLLNKLDLKLKQPQILVLTPTRELAIQVAEAFQTYARHLKGFHVLPIYGGQSMGIQLQHLKRGPHVIVATPGRVMDHMRRKSLKLDTLRALVLDEADEMLRMGFIDDVEWILEQTPEQRQIALFSATMPDIIRKVARKYLNKPIEIKIKSKTSTVETIEQHYWQVSGTNKLDALTRILEVQDFDASIIFVRTRTATVELAEKLEARGYRCAALNGDISQDLRERTVQQLKNKKLDIIIATDVAARGLDVQRISHVINYDIPNDVESYVHRIGRTGRAGRKGCAILFVAPREMRMLSAIERATKQKIERVQLPSSEVITNKRISQFKETVLETIESGDLDFFHDIIDQIQHEHDISVEQIAAALARQAQTERPLRMKELPKA
ncbi:MAG: DEAD/DEAH box helicase, partial [Gammaproteobacteria bacterium]|nr:DEAD/DEAH box helicase [Gammaproteobacteria bacterium]